MSILCSLPIIASLLGSCLTHTPIAVGYVEGESVMLAPLETAKVVNIGVRRGERITEGTVLATLETQDVDYSIKQAQASLAQAQAQLANLKIGKRPEEIEVLEATLKSAEAKAKEARRVADRTQNLLNRGTASQSQFDKASTSLKVADTAVRQAQANLNVSKLPARDEEIRAAAAQVEQAKANLSQAEWRLNKRQLTSQASGRVQDIIRNPGDLAGPSAPILQILPDGATKLTIYMPQESVSKFKPGEKIDVRCDNCPQNLQAEISYISPEPEFTPPVIFSLETRQKLVFLVEAKPIGATSNLNPGQIVDVFKAEVR